MDVPCLWLRHRLVEYLGGRLGGGSARFDSAFFLAYLIILFIILIAVCPLWQRKPLRLYLF